MLKSLVLWSLVLWSLALWPLVLWPLVLWPLVLCLGSLARDPQRDLDADGVEVHLHRVRLPERPVMKTVSFRRVRAGARRERAVIGQAPLGLRRGTPVLERLFEPALRYTREPTVRQGNVRSKIRISSTTRRCAANGFGSQERRTCRSHVSLSYMT
jgi:hypothetical protein